MNIRDEDFKKYLEIFHSTLQETADHFLSPDLKKRILHLSYLPSRIIGYISTQFGVGFEYISAENTKIEIKRGSARIEDLIFQTPRWLGKRAPLFRVGSHIKMYGPTIIDAFPLRLVNRNAGVVLIEMTFKAGQWNRTINFAELDGNREYENWTTDKAVARAKDEILAALVDHHQADLKGITIDEFISHYKEKTVLLLGDYGDDGMQRLELIRKALAELNYNPILVKDIPDHFHHDLSQKLVAIGAISRFIIVDDSSKSGHLMELEICKNNRWVTIIMRANEEIGSWITKGASYYSSVIFETSYDPRFPDKALCEAVELAERKLKELTKSFENIYPWRKTSN